MERINAKELRQKYRENPQLPVVNVLDNDTYRAEHIPGSLNIPVSRNDFERAVEQKVGGKEQPVVVYCADKACNASPKAAERLEKAGFKNVYDFEGGMDEWKRSDFPVEKSP